MILHEPIFNADFLNRLTRDNFKHNFVAAMVGNGMLHETIANATLENWATVLEVFESLSKPHNMLQQLKVALKCLKFTMLPDIDFERNSTNNVVLKVLTYSFLILLVEQRAATMLRQDSAWCHLLSSVSGDIGHLHLFFSRLSPGLNRSSHLHSISRPA